MKVRLLLSSVVLLSTMWLIGCGHYVCGTTFGSSTCTPSGGGLGQGGGGNSISQTAFVYFMDDNVPQMAVEGLNVANSQTFAPLSSFVSPGFAESANTADGGIVIVDKKYLYVPFVSGDLYAFSIDTTTSDLTQIGSTYLASSGTFSTIVADPNGAVLFVGGSAGISVYTISATDGSLTAVATTSTGGITPTQLVTDGAGKYLYALTGGTITAFSYTSSGVLGSPLSFTPTPAMAQLAGELSGKFLLGISAETGGGSGAIDKNIYVFSIATGGGLSTFGSPVPTQNPPAYLVVSPNGKFVYTFDQTVTATSTTDDPMEGFAFSTGTLSELTGVSPFTGLDASIGKFDQSGQYIFAVATVTGQSLPGEFAYGVDSSGALSNTLAHAGVVGASFAVTDEP